MKKDLSRRQFLHRTAGAAGALAASPAIFLEPEHIHGPAEISLQLLNLPPLSSR